MSPENQRLEDAFAVEIVPFLGDMLVFRGVYYIYIDWLSPFPVTVSTRIFSCLVGESLEIFATVTGGG